jgi:predicted negative regulator of RcsB-dependent stress response/GTPase SAR1 family protein
MSEQNNNPYIAGASIGGTETFVGRIDILKQVQYTLRHPQESAIVLHGQRRIGKTSILYELKKKLERTYHPVYFDLIGKAHQSLEETLQELANTISLDLNKGTVNLGHNPKTEFSQVWLPNFLNTLTKSLVLLFDEFDALDDPSFKETSDAFFRYVHGLLPINPERLSFVFVIGRNINDLHDVASALCKDVNDTIHVSLLDHEDTVKLIRFSVENNTLHWSDKTIEKVWQLTHGHPYLTQSLCKNIWNRLYDENPKKPPIVTLNDIENAIPNALKSSHSALDWLWKGLQSPERVVVSALAKVGEGIITEAQLQNLLIENGIQRVIPKLEQAPQILKNWDIIEPDDGGYCFRVELFRQWIAKYKPLNKIKKDELDNVIPVANDLYKAACRLFEAGQLDKAFSTLQDAINYNPNHIGATQLLADILLAQGKTSEARDTLEELFKKDPSAARSRLIDVLLTLAKTGDDENEKLSFYTRLFELDEQQPEIESHWLQEVKLDWEQIWQKRGDEAYKAGNLNNALSAYKKALDKAVESESELDRKILQIKAEIQKRRRVFLEKNIQLKASPDTELEWNIITGSKGGEGKTMLALLLLTRNLELGKSTLIIDLNATNTDSSAILLEERRRDRRIVIEHETANNSALVEQVGANQIIVQRTFSPLKQNQQRDYYAVAWPSNPYGLYKSSLFADFLCTIKKNANRIQKELEMPALESVIIDTNYHFCNIFSTDEQYYKEYQEGILKNDSIKVWFLWVYRQLNNLIKANEEGDARAMYATAGAMEAYLKRADNLTPFMHVFTPVALVSSKPEKSAGAAALIKLINAIRSDEDDTIQGLEEIENLPKGNPIRFRNWVDRLETARLNLQRQGHNEPHSLFLNMFINASQVQNRDNYFELPKNVIPLSVYHPALQYYTDRSSSDPVSEIKDFTLYKKFFDLLQ